MMYYATMLQNGCSAHLYLQFKGNSIFYNIAKTLKCLCAQKLSYSVQYVIISTMTQHHSVQSSCERSVVRYLSHSIALITNELLPAFYTVLQY